MKLFKLITGIAGIVAIILSMLSMALQDKTILDLAAMIFVPIILTAIGVTIYEDRSKM